MCPARTFSRPQTIELVKLSFHSSPQRPAPTDGDRSRVWIVMCPSAALAARSAVYIGHAPHWHGIALPQDISPAGQGHVGLSGGPMPFAVNPQFVAHILQPMPVKIK